MARDVGVDAMVLEHIQRLKKVVRKQQPKSYRAKRKRKRKRARKARHGKRK